MHYKQLLSSLAVAFACTIAAHADSFSFSFGTSADVFAGAGSLTGNLLQAATGTSDAQYLITAVTGTTRTSKTGSNLTISSIDPTGSFGNNDNILYESAAGAFSFDSQGLTYSLANGAKVNLFFTSGQFLMRANGAVIGENAVIHVAATPEPGSFLLLGTGALGMLSAARRRLFA